MRRSVLLTLMVLIGLVSFALAGDDAQASGAGGCSGSDYGAAGCAGDHAAASCGGYAAHHRVGFFARWAERRAARRAARAARYAHYAAAGCGDASYAAPPVQYQSSGNCPSGLCPR